MYRTRFLVDTDIIINYLKGMGNARDFLMRIIDERVLGFFSVITEAELLSGSRNADDESAIYSILDYMEAIEVERNIAVTAGKLRQKYYAAYRVELPDAIIAATANRPVAKQHPLHELCAPTLHTTPSIQQCLRW